MLQMFIDWYGKAESVLKEVRVGFPEMLKQHILAVGHDVSVFFTTHGMVVALAVAAVFTIGLVSYLAVRVRQLKRQVSIEKSNTDFARAVRQRWEERSSTYRDWWHESRRKETISSQELEAERVRNEELSGMNTTLNDKVDEMQVDLDEANSEISRLESEIESLEEQVIDLRDDVSETNGNLFRVEEERDELENELETLRNNFETSTKLVEILK
ncbi:TMhelix containing protein [Vibrio phage 1.253.O._10N.286.45.B12]|nr:TMhelix containing protein [Vibrio phage 1.235.O._10N.261.52.B2]AUR98563.1 TMhelix containing protein [Vibrio phage 1.253.O._10N.286.45.B12]